MKINKSFHNVGSLLLVSAEIPLALLSDGAHTLILPIIPRPHLNIPRDTGGVEIYPVPQSPEEQQSSSYIFKVKTLAGEADIYTFTATDDRN